MKVSFFAETLVQAHRILQDRQQADARIDVEKAEFQPGEAKGFRMFQGILRTHISTLENAIASLAVGDGSSELQDNQLQAQVVELLAALQTASTQVSCKLAHLATQCESQVLWATDNLSPEDARNDILKKRDLLLGNLRLITYESEAMKSFLDARAELLRIAAL